MCIETKDFSKSSNEGSNMQHTTWQKELEEQLCTSGPAMLSMLLTKIPWLISLRFVGKMGSDALAAAALATTLCNVTGMSLSVGVSSAMSTLAGQSRGKALVTRTIDKELEQETLLLPTNNYGSISKDAPSSPNDEYQPPTPPIIMPLLYLYRGMLIQLLLVIPVGCWWIYGIKPLLLFLGQGEVLSTMTQDYLRILTPALWAYSANWTITSWLQAMEMADVPVNSTVIGVVLHIPFNIFFISHFGYLGVAMATAAFQLVQLLCVCVYLFCTKAGIARVLDHCGSVGTTLSFWREASLAMSMVGMLQYLSLALPGIVIISEWWASEVSIFLSGTLTPTPNLALDGMTIYQSINTFCFMFPVGCSIAGSTRVSMFLGLGDVHGAALAAKVSIASATVLSAVMGMILYWSPHSFFPSWFSPDGEVVAEASQLIPLLAIYVFGDGIQSALNGVIKGCGRQCIIMPIVVFAYWIVGVPLAYYISFIRHNGVMCQDSYFCGVRGLVTGMTTGTFVHMLLLAIVVVCTTNWNVEAARARERMAVEKHDRKLPSPSEVQVPL